MNTQKFGAFIATSRKEKNMTQADLAMKLHVTDKAVSRWERGIGFPDINTIQPLADALEISILELMKSERTASQTLTSEETTKIITNTLKLAKSQQKQERKNAFTILGITSIALTLILCLDNIHRQADTILITGAGMAFPLLCLCGFASLLGYGIWRKATGKPSRQTLALALALPLFLIIFFGLFFLLGAAQN